MSYSRTPPRLENESLKKVSGFFGTLLSNRDWVYLSGLLVPFVVHHLALKSVSIASRPERFGFARVLKLIRSDISFDTGYACLWAGLFAVAKRGLLRRMVVILFHAMTVFVAIVRTGAYQYFRETGTTLDYDIIALWAPKPAEVKPMIQLPLPARALLAASLLYTTLGPPLLTRVLGRNPPERTLNGTSRTSLLRTLGPFLLALGFGSLSLPASPGSAGASRSFARDPFVNVVLTGLRRHRRGRISRSPVVGHPTAGARLVPTTRTTRRNVVLVHLESTRAHSVTPYNRVLKTTPFLDNLAGVSLLVERAYTPVPHTSKAIVSVNCGVYPRLDPAAEREPGSIPAPCLAGLLREQGYQTVFFQSSTQNFEDLGDLANRLGYEEYYPLESMSTEGFERSNYFGYEDDVMLGPSEEWLREHGDRPFVAKYLTGTGHHEYLPPTRYGHLDFAEDDRLNRYLNCLRYQDFFVKNLIDQYKNLGLYDNTVFVLYGDHGEAFGEHGRYAHDDVPYDECLRVPLIIHYPKRFRNGERVEGLSNLTDVLPTVVDLLGYEIQGGKYPGHSLLGYLPKDRALVFSCFNEDKCLGSIKGFEKYIYHYGNQPDELFDLSKDPLERENLAGDQPEEAYERREELLAWRSGFGTASKAE
jgi:lipoteichoic acid synthase